MKRGKAGTLKAAEKRRLWVEAMLTNGGNATAAAVAIGHKPGWAAEKAGHRLSKNVQTQQLLERRRAEVLAAAQEKAQLTADEVMLSLARDLRFDPSKLYRTDGTLKPIHEMDEDTRLALRGTEIDEIALGKGEDRTVVGHTVKVKFPEKTAAREQGMKHFGLYEADNRQKPAPAVNIGTLSVGLEFEKVRARARHAKHA